MPGAEQQGGDPHGPIMDPALAEAARTAAGLPTEPQPGCIAGEAAIVSVASAPPFEGDKLMKNSYKGDQQPETD